MKIVPRTLYTEANKSFDCIFQQGGFMRGFSLPILSILFLINSAALFAAQEHCTQTLGRNLYHAAHRGNRQTVEILIELGADANYQMPGCRPVNIFRSYAITESYV